eukprot:7021896-Alexandrium_andersonii.AAC.1
MHHATALSVSLGRRAVDHDGVAALQCHPERLPEAADGTRPLLQVSRRQPPRKGHDCRANSAARLEDHRD